MPSQKPKILLAKPGLDGHDVGVKVLAHALIDAGYAIVYSGLRKSIPEIVKMAISKKVDIIGLSILSGTHVEICKQMDNEMKKSNLFIPWIVGGNIPDNDIEKIKKVGAKAAFSTGTTIEEVIHYINQLTKKF